jgi:hypothetical protein
MLSARVVSEGVRAVFPGVLGGFYTPEEVGQFEPVAAAPFAYARPEPQTPVLTDAPPLRIDPVTGEVEPESVPMEFEYVAPEPVKAAPARKKQPAAAITQPADYETVTFLKASRKSGTSAKGREWTRWGALVNRNGSDVWLNTFDEAFGAIIDEANEGDTFNVELKEGERGIDMIDLRASDVQDKTETADALAEAD